LLTNQCRRQRFDGRLVRVGDDVAVDGQGDDRARVSEPGADRADRDAAREQMRGVRVAEVVEAPVPDLRGLAERLEAPRGRLRAQEAAELVSEDQIGAGGGVTRERTFDLLTLPVFAERLDRPGPVKREGPVAPRRLAGP